MLKAASKINRTGHHSPSANRAVSRGSSLATVPAPTAIPGNNRRQRITSARAASPVIHFDSPVRQAMRPSIVVATFAASNGRPVVIQWLKIRFRSAHSSASTPASTFTPAARNSASPCPACCGFGSVAPTTTCFSLAARIASVQGGVRPWVQQGSSVT